MGKEMTENMKWLADSMIENFPGCILRVAYTDEAMTLEYVSDGILNIIGFTPEE